MKRIFIAALIAGLPGVVFAADLNWTPPIIPDQPQHGHHKSGDFVWSGFQLGAQGGWGWATGSRDPATAGDWDVDGWLAGGFAGYNHQLGFLVLGVEGDFE